MGKIIPVLLVNISVFMGCVSFSNRCSDREGCFPMELTILESHNLMEEVLAYHDKIEKASIRSVSREYYSLLKSIKEDGKTSVNLIKLSIIKSSNKFSKRNLSGALRDLRKVKRKLHKDSRLHNLVNLLIFDLNQRVKLTDDIAKHKREKDDLEKKIKILSNIERKMGLKNN